MDSLLDSLKKIKINNNTNNNLLDDLIIKIEKTNLVDPEQEWSKIKDNYTKLKYLKEISEYLGDLNTFLKPFKKYMEKIITTNQYYIKNICLDETKYTNTDDFINLNLDSIKKIIKEINTNLCDSINTNELIKQLDYTLKAYSGIITLAEDLRQEKYKETEIEETFINNFPNKKQKINNIFH
jgi:hypothetical protein